jgi:hypothetical protein
MCELLVRVVDKVNPNCPYADAQCTKRGDVIVVVEDGWQWGREEVNNPTYQIVRVPGVPAEQAASFLSQEIGDSPVKSKMLRKRGFSFDLSRPLPTNYTELMACRVVKKPLADPNVLG